MASQPAGVRALYTVISRAGAVAPVLRLEQIAPIVAALLDVAFDGPDGVLLPGLLTR